MGVANAPRFEPGKALLNFFALGLLLQLGSFQLLLQNAPLRFQRALSRNGSNLRKVITTLLAPIARIVPAWMCVFAIVAIAPHARFGAVD
jgi:hypothetical protein